MSAIKDYVNVPFMKCPPDVFDAMDKILRLSIKRINDLPVVCELSYTGVTIRLPKFYKYRSSMIYHVNKCTLASCLEEISKIEIDASGERKNKDRDLEAEVYEYIGDILDEVKHVDVAEYRCSVCYSFTDRMVHGSSHPVCNRCIVRLDKCPICRLPIETLPEAPQTDYDEDSDGDYEEDSDATMYEDDLIV
jgi:hypothetical protein